jgi:hypothetical protein
VDFRRKDPDPMDRLVRGIKRGHAFQAEPH